MVHYVLVFHFKESCVHCKLYHAVFLALQMGHPRDSSVLFAYMFEILFTCLAKKNIHNNCLAIIKNCVYMQVYWEMIQ